MVEPDDLAAQRAAGRSAWRTAEQAAQDAREVADSPDLQQYKAQTDTVAVTYPLTLDSTTDPGVANVQAFTVPHLEASLTPNAGVANTVAEGLMVDVGSGWITTGTPQEVKAGDMIETFLWGTWANDTTTGGGPGGTVQTDLRVRVGGLTGVVAISHRIPNTVPSIPGSRPWVSKTTSLVVDSGAGVLVLHSFGNLIVGGASVGSANVHDNSRPVVSAAVDFTADQEWTATADHDVAWATVDMVVTHALFRHTQARP